jgi:hypothetical protein
MGNALAEMKVTLSQLEGMRKAYEEKRRGEWEKEQMPKLRGLMASKKDYVGETLKILHDSNTNPDQLLCAANDRVDCEYTQKVLEAASKDASLSEKHRESAGVLKKEFERRERENAVLERVFIAEDLISNGNFREGSGVLKELSPKVKEMAEFYMKDIEEKLGKSLGLYLPEPQSYRRLVEWNTIKGRLGEAEPSLKLMGEVLDDPDRFSHVERYNAKTKFSDALHGLAVVRFYEEELSLAYAKKMGMFNETS